MLSFVPKTVIHTANLKMYLGLLFGSLVTIACSGLRKRMLMEPLTFLSKGCELLPYVYTRDTESANLSITELVSYVREPGYIL